MEVEKTAQYAFIAFVFIAVITGIAVGFMAYNANSNFPYGWSDQNIQNVNGWITLVLLILGIVVGLVSITVKEVTPFLLAAIALIVASMSNVWSPLETVHPILAYWAEGILNNIVAFAAPAAVLNAIKLVLAIAKEK